MQANKDEMEKLIAESPANDAWIDSIPDDPYSLCPCGCGKKFKFCIPEIEKHEEQFKQNWMKQNQNNP